VSTRKRTEEILELKQRNPFDFDLHSYRLDSLRSEWDKISESASEYADFYIIRAVTLLEVSVRSGITRLINHGAPYVQRAASLVKDLKFDYELVSDLQGKTITLGDLVAHSLSLNKIEQLLAAFSILLDKNARSAIESVAEFGEPAAAPIIQDYDWTVRTLSNLLRVRHILVHEVPRSKVYDQSEVTDFLNAVYVFCRATETAVSLEMFGKIPKTQQEMNIDAYNREKEAESKMESVLAQVRDIVAERGRGLASIYAGTANVPAHFKQNAEEWLELFERSQNAWTEYRDRFSEFRHYLNRTGRVYPSRLSSSLTTMTDARTEELAQWLDLDRKLHDL
jgi:uncharacterized protein YecT (DUF1311 family)